MASGGVTGPVWLNMVALAARKHAVPFVVVAGTHKMSIRSPAIRRILRLHGLSCGSGTPLLNVVNPAFHYVPPELVSLLVTGTGGHNPSFMYRLIADYNSADDLNLQKKATS
eukprot:XP_024462809.1 translation initiation factor eIF-2B subunit beta [Populus trichocarpa]